MSAEFKFELTPPTLFLKGRVTVDNLPKSFKLFQKDCSKQMMEQIETVDLTQLVEVDSLVWAFLLWLQAQTKASLSLNFLSDKAYILANLYGLKAHFSLPNSVEKIS